MEVEGWVGSGLTVGGADGLGGQVALAVGGQFPWHGQLHLDHAGSPA